MADVRSMLRAERQARAPQKQKPQVAASNDKKRKALDDEEDARKRTRADDHASAAASLLRQSSLFREAEDTSVVDAPVLARKPSLPATPAPPVVPATAVNEDEWAAFERDMASLPLDTATKSSNNDSSRTGATISAAPMTASELAAQASEEKNAQRARRDSDIAAEKEDAQRELEEEFEEMEQLEKRVQRLKEMREKVRAARAEPVVVDKPPGPIAPVNQDIGNEDEYDDDDDDDDDDLDDGWTFRPV